MLLNIPYGTKTIPQAKANARPWENLLILLPKLFGKKIFS
jgi:hypothetical protein